MKNERGKGMKEFGNLKMMEFENGETVDFPGLGFLGRDFRGCFY